MIVISSPPFSLFEVDGIPTRIYTKYLTGVLDGNANETIAHGVTSGLTKILSLLVHVFDGDVNKYRIDEVRMAASAPPSYDVHYDAFNISFLQKGSSIINNNYRIKIDYIL